jgi:hypothetical protein
MKTPSCFQLVKLVPVVTAAAFLASCAAAPKPGPWRMLFDGQDTSAWRTFGGKEFPKTGWVVEDGCLRLLPGGRGGQLVTKDTFDNYEFEWEWRLGPRGNNGVKYLVT